MLVEALQRWDEHSNDDGLSFARETIWFSNKFAIIFYENFTLLFNHYLLLVIQNFSLSQDKRIGNVPKWCQNLSCLGTIAGLCPIIIARRDSSLRTVESSYLGCSVCWSIWFVTLPASFRHRYRLSRDTSCIIQPACDVPRAGIITTAGNVRRRPLL